MNIQSQVYSIKEFCKAFGISEPTFYNWRKKGLAPKVMQVGGRTLIAIDAVNEWRRERENAA
ncbi:helix-turn-helix transcriptional regulator [Phyllobacterium endophyticum]|nr:helix-turn-helix domain-containing protein [Phyllobacterium endophyticum]MBB3234526.1 excisionase family DNA binding protein [Phyllobacterium endophyticum]TYR38680.1 helix-turn-helix domain-containing protein [Phyllobacterium endophyticum]